MDDRAIADIGLSRADVEGLNVASWQDHLPTDVQPVMLPKDSR